MIVLFLRNQTYFVSQRSQTDVGVVLPEQNAIFGPGGEHAIGFVDAFGHQVVDQYADIGFVAFQNDRTLPFHCPVGIDARYQALRRRFLISRRTVNLPGEVKTRNQFRFE